MVLVKGNARGTLTMLFTLHFRPLREFKVGELGGGAHVR